MTVTANKRQLIELICKYLIDHPIDSQYALIVTGSECTPVEFNKGVTIRTTHEEADVIIENHVSYLAGLGTEHIRVIADDTDVFALLLYDYHIVKA